MAEIKINLTNAWLFFIIGVGVFSLLVVGGWAFNPGNSPPANPAVMGHTLNEVQMPNCQAGEVLVKTATGWGCKASGSQGPVAQQKYYVIDEVNYITTWADCVEGYAAIAFWDDDNDFTDIDKMKCEYFGTNNDCEAIGITSSYDGGPKGPKDEWRVECSSNRVIRGIGDRSGGGFNTITGVLCCGGVSVDKNNCDVITITNGMDKGPSSELNRWAVQCRDGYAVVAVWDDNNNFGDLDAIKCCPVS